MAGISFIPDLLYQSRAVFRGRARQFHLKLFHSRFQCLQFKKTMKTIIALSLLLILTSQVYATNFEDCLLRQIEAASGETTASDMRNSCKQQRENNFLPERLLQEQATENQSFVITPYRQNYVLPATHNSKPNQSPYQSQNTFPTTVKAVKEEEAKLQISFKVPLSYDDILFPHDGLYFGFTLKSFWQVYNEDTSKPFRETNYRPEVFYQVPLPIRAWEGVFFTRVGFEHESNGRSQFLSRSWNRLYAGLGFIRDNWIIYVQPWYRIPEDKKEDDGDPLTPPSPKGDDNPDIHKFLGRYELNAVWKHQEIEVSSLFRQNFSTGKGAVELGVSFPLWGRLKGYVQYYNGYGESMIDYDHRVNRIGFGILLTDLL